MRQIQVRRYSRLPWIGNISPQLVYLPVIEFLGNKFRNLSSCWFYLKFISIVTRWLLSDFSYKYLYIISWTNLLDLYTSSGTVYKYVHVTIGYYEQPYNRTEYPNLTKVLEFLNWRNLWLRLMVHLLCSSISPECVKKKSYIFIF